MRYLHNEKGIALVLVLVFSMVGLAVVTAMLFMITQQTQVGGAFKMYRSADEAGLGATGLVTDMIKARGVNPALTAYNTFGLDACLQQKLSTARGISAAGWTLCTAATRLTMDPDSDWDLSSTLPGPPGSDFITRMKIVDTVQGNTDAGGLVGSGELSGTGVVASTSGQVTPPAVPYMYRIEVQTENSTNPNERSRYSVLYAY